MTFKTARSPVALLGSAAWMPNKSAAGLPRAFSVAVLEQQQLLLLLGVRDAAGSAVSPGCYDAMGIATGGGTVCLLVTNHS